MKKILLSLLPDLVKEGILLVMSRFFRTSFGGYDAKSIFSEIYTHQKWGKGESASGSGSALDATENIRNQLPKIWQDVGITTILDISCGDFHWMRQILPSHIRYIGADIVPEIIQKNTQLYTQPHISFQILDMIYDDLPRVDLVICRDTWVHWDVKSIHIAIQNLKKSGSTYLISTSFPQKSFNYDISMGNWRALNLQKKPFCFPPPIYSIPETTQGGLFGDKALLMWKIKDLP